MQYNLPITDKKLCRYYDVRNSNTDEERYEFYMDEYRNIYDNTIPSNIFPLQGNQFNQGDRLKFNDFIMFASVRFSNNTTLRFINSSDEMINYNAQSGVYQINNELLRNPTHNSKFYFNIIDNTVRINFPTKLKQILQDDGFLADHGAHYDVGNNVNYDQSYINLNDGLYEPKNITVSVYLLDDNNEQLQMHVMDLTLGYDNTGGNRRCFIVNNNKPILIVDQPSSRIKFEIIDNLLNQNLTNTYWRIFISKVFAANTASKCLVV
ncbi:hypothetical protein F-LCD7_0232 [Faustovirus]|nr:hypothetical protein F-LCD7_0232 [Faustovirus]